MGKQPSGQQLRTLYKCGKIERKQAGLFKIAPYWTRITEYMVRNGKGKHTHGSILNRAMELCKEKYRKCVWPKVPEECFRQVFEEMERL